jgi:hypothetical protein
MGSYMGLMKVKLVLWLSMVIAVIGLSIASGYSLIPAQFLPFRWAISLTPFGLVQGFFETEAAKIETVQYVLSAPAIRPGYGDVPGLWCWGVAVALAALSLLAVHFPLQRRKY